MLKDLLLYLKYPAVAGVIAVIWLGSAAFIVVDPTLPVSTIMPVNLIVSLFIAFIGFRVEKD